MRWRWWGWGSGQQVLLLHLGGSNEMVVVVEAAGGGNCSARTLFTQFAVQMKSVVPKHGVTEGGGGEPRRLLHQ